MKALISCVILFTLVIICFADTTAKRPKRDSFTGGSFFNQGGNYHEMAGTPGQAPPRYVDLTSGQGGRTGQENNFGGQSNQGFNQQGSDNGGGFADQGFGNNEQASPQYAGPTPGQGGIMGGRGQGNSFGGQPNQGSNQQGSNNNGSR